MRIVIWLLFSSVVCSCGPINYARASEPVGLVTPMGGEANGDAVWMVRSVQALTTAGASKGIPPWMSGLFACYRKPKENPGHPTCYSAKMIVDWQDITWPGKFEFKDGEFYIDGKIITKKTGAE